MKTTYIVNLLYLLIAVNTTYFLGKSLNRHGEHFLRAIFKDRMEIVLPVNKILLIGFYLVNMGLILMFHSAQEEITNLKDSILYLSIKTGITYIVIALMHYLNILVFIVIESRISKQTSKLQ
jgi:hypothetical protein